MAHPHLRLVFEATEQWVGSVNVLKMGTSVLPRLGALHLSAVCIGYELSSVAYTQHRIFADKSGKINLESLLVVH